MELAELQRRVEEFVREMGFYEPDSPHEQTPRGVAISLALEAAEVLEHYQWREVADKDSVSEELADVTNYLLQLAQLLGIDLEQAVLAKLEKDRRRRW